MDLLPTLPPSITLYDAVQAGLVVLPDTSKLRFLRLQAPVSPVVRPLVGLADGFDFSGAEASPYFPIVASGDSFLELRAPSEPLSLRFFTSQSIMFGQHKRVKFLESQVEDARRTLQARKDELGMVLEGLIDTATFNVTALAELYRSDPPALATPGGKLLLPGGPGGPVGVDERMCVESTPAMDAGSKECGSQGDGSPQDALVRSLSPSEVPPLLFVTECGDDGLGNLSGEPVLL